MDAKPCNIDVELYTQFGSAGRKIGGPKLQDARGVDGSPHTLVVADCWTNQINVYQHRKGEIQYLKSIKLTGDDGGLKSPRDVALMGDKVLVVDGTAIVRLFDVQLNDPASGGSSHCSTTYSVRSDDDSKKIKINVDCIAASPGGEFFVVADKISRKVTTHSLSTGLRSSVTVDVSPSFIAYHDGQIAVSDYEVGRVCVYDLESGAKLSQFDAPSVRGVAFYHDDRNIIAACSDGLFGTGTLRQYHNGVFVEKISDGLYFPQGMHFLSPDKVAVADKTTAKIFRVRKV